MTTNSPDLPPASAGWSLLPSGVVNAAKDIAEAGKLDDAILAAFRLVEAEIQERIGSRNIGQTLIIEAFAGALPRIRIGLPSDQNSVQALFSGALGLIRGDRSHKREPALPCPSMEVCFHYLHFAALLLHILAQDRTLLPVVQSLSAHGLEDQARLEFRGTNLHRVREVRANDEALQIIQRSETLIEALAPGAFVGDVSLHTENEEVYRSRCDARSPYAVLEGVYEVIDMEVPLYSDPTGSVPRTDCVGLMLLATEGGLTFTRILPSESGKYQKGQMVTHGPFDNARRVARTWYRDTTSGDIRPAWDWSTLASPQILAQKTDPVTTGIIALPRILSVEPGDIITLNARTVESIGSVRRESDQTDKLKWASVDTHIAHVDSRGILRAKAFGRTEIECSAKGFHSKIDVRVEHHDHGDKSAYFEGLRGTQQIVFDSDDNLYITNQTERVYRLRKAGGLEIALQVAKHPNDVYRLDCIAIDASNNLYVPDPSSRGVRCFDWKGDRYQSGRLVVADQPGTKKSIAVSAGLDLYVGVMIGPPGAGAVLSVHRNGTVATFATRDSANNLALGTDGRIYVSAPRFGAIDVFEPSGNLVGSIDHGLREGVGAIMVGPDLAVYIATFHSGRVLRFKPQNGVYETSEIATGLGNPCGLAINSQGRIYVGEFATGRITAIY